MLFYVLLSLVLTPLALLTALLRRTRPFWMYGERQFLVSDTLRSLGAPSADEIAEGEARATLAFKSALPGPWNWQTQPLLASMVPPPGWRLMDFGPASALYRHLIRVPTAPATTTPANPSAAERGWSVVAVWDARLAKRAPAMARALYNTVAALAPIGTPFEVILVDDASGDTAACTAILTKLVQAEGMEHVRYMRFWYRRGLGGAVARGALVARFPAIVFGTLDALAALDAVALTALLETVTGPLTPGIPVPGSGSATSPVPRQAPAPKPIPQLTIVVPPARALLGALSAPLQLVCFDSLTSGHTAFLTHLTARVGQVSMARVLTVLPDPVSRALTEGQVMVRDRGLAPPSTLRALEEQLWFRLAWVTGRTVSQHGRRLIQVLARMAAH